MKILSGRRNWNEGGGRSNQARTPVVEQRPQKKWKVDKTRRYGMKRLMGRNQDRTDKATVDRESWHSEESVLLCRRDIVAVQISIAKGDNMLAEEFIVAMKMAEGSAIQIERPKLSRNKLRMRVYETPFKLLRKLMSKVLLLIENYKKSVVSSVKPNTMKSDVKRKGKRNGVARPKKNNSNVWRNDATGVMAATDVADLLPFPANGVVRMTIPFQTLLGVALVLIAAVFGHIPGPLGAVAVLILRVHLHHHLAANPILVLTIVAQTKEEDRDGGVKTIDPPHAPLVCGNVLAKEPIVISGTKMVTMFQSNHGKIEAIEAAIMQQMIPLLGVDLMTLT